MLTAPTTFSKLDLAIHRTRARYKYKQDEWEALSDEKKCEDLSYDYYRQKKIKQMLDPFWNRINDEKPISSVEAFYALMLESI